MEFMFWSVVKNYFIVIITGPKVPRIIFHNQVETRQMIPVMAPMIDVNFDEFFWLYIKPVKPFVITANPNNIIFHAIHF